MELVCKLLSEKLRALLCLAFFYSFEETLALMLWLVVVSARRPRLV